jgi:hypothetical protein
MGLPIGACAQWLHYPAAGTPRTKHGKPNLTAAPPRTRDGKPDLSGVWEPEGTPIPVLLRIFPDIGKGVPAPLGSEPITPYFVNFLADFKAGESPLQPTAVARKDDPSLHCLPIGMPMFDTYPAPFKIVQTSGLILLLSESDTDFRQVFTDGRQLPEDPQPSWLGSSIGRWEGETLVVDTAGLNDRSLVDFSGHGHSENLRVTERFHRVNFGKIELQVTLDDPKTFTKPVTAKFNLVLFPDTDLIESYCSENEKDHIHIAGQ